MTHRQTIGWIGLGKMGLPIATRLAAAGHQVAGFDRDQQRIAEASAGGVTPAATLTDAAGRDIGRLLAVELVGVEDGRTQHHRRRQGQIGDVGEAFDRRRGGLGSHRRRQRQGKRQDEGERGRAKGDHSNLVIEPP